MRVILGKSVTDAALTATNVPETAPAAWSSGTTYALGDIVSIATGTTQAVYESLQGANLNHAPASSPTWWQQVATTYSAWSSGSTYAKFDRVIDPTAHRAYESVQAGNLNHALTDTAWWLDLGPTNRWAMFDQTNGTQTSRYGLVDVSVQITGRANSLALIGLAGQSVQVTVSTALAGTIYDETFSLLSDVGITDWYSYLNEEIVYRSTLVVSDLPYNLDPLIRVRVSATNATAAVGSLVVGPLWTIGDTIYPAKAGIRDYSRVEPDQYGNYTVVPRAFSRRQTLKIALDPERVDITHERLASYRATPLVWVGSDSYDSLVSFGFLRDWAIDISSPAYAYLTAELEGLT